MDKQKKWYQKTIFRLEAIIPLFFVALVSSLYFSLFFDRHLKSALEWGGAQLVGAEVNIDHLRTSFWRGNLLIDNIQVTDRNDPQYNLLQIGKLIFDLDTVSLLRLRTIIEEARILDIGLYTERARPGRVYPREQSEFSLFNRLLFEVREQLKEQYSETFLSSLSDLFSGGDFNQQLDQLRSGLTAEQNIAQLQERLSEQQDFWENNLQEIQSGAVFDELSDEISSFRFNSSRPQDSLRQARDLLSQAKSEVARVDQLRSQFQSDIQSLSVGPRELNQWIENDIATIRSELHIPSLDTDAFAKGLFGRFFGEMIGQYVAYSQQLQQWIPSQDSQESQKSQKSQKKNKDKKNKEVEVVERSSGEVFHFPITSGGPRFWLKEAQISSSSDNRAWSGVFEGQARDLTNGPELVGRAGVLELRGELPEQDILGLELLLTLHFHKKPHYQELKVSSSQFPFRPLHLSREENVSLIIIPQQGEFHFSAKNQKDEQEGHNIISLSYQQTLRETSIQSSATSHRLTTLLDDSLSGLNQVTLEASAHGPVNRLRFEIRSNLARALERGIRGQIEGEIAQFEERLRDDLRRRVDPLLDQYNSQKDQFSRQYQRLFSQSRDRARSLENEAQSHVESSVTGDSGVRQRADEAVDSLRRRLGR